MLSIITFVFLFSVVSLIYLTWVSHFLYCLIYISFIIYFLCASPLLYRWWIIPKIEKRYGKKLVFNYPIYRMNFFPPIDLEVSQYIVFALFGYIRKENKYEALPKINYDVKTASKSEIIVSFITFGSLSLIILIPLVHYLLSGRVI